MTKIGYPLPHSCLSIFHGLVAQVASPDPRHVEVFPKAIDTLPSDAELAAHDAELAARDAELAARDAIIKSILLKLSLK
jgi:hypothetical protein